MVTNEALAKLPTLIQGIKPAFTGIDRARRATRRELLSRERNRNIIIVARIRNELPQIERIRARKDDLFQLYDEVVLKGYQPEKDQAYQKARKDTCVPCLRSYPLDYPAWVRIDWGLSHLGSSRNTIYGMLLDDAFHARGQEAEELGYFLRWDLKDRLDLIAQEHEATKNSRLRKTLWEGADCEREDPTAKEEDMLELRDQKERLGWRMVFTRYRYNFMVDLTTDKLIRELVTS